MKTITSVLVFLFPIFVFGTTVRGVVKAPNGQPLDYVTIEAGRRLALTTPDGMFTIDVPEGVQLLRVSAAGFQPLNVTPQPSLDITLKPALGETIIVSGIRAEEKTPVTKTNVERAEIERDYHGQDIPLLLRDTPSINAYAEAGSGGSGYSYITLRGISPTRINFTLDGVPLADSEDMATYFADFPDLARSLQSIQVQRGVGTSTVGSPSFGGSINLESIAPSQTPSTDVELGGGSFGTKFATVGLHSGLLQSGWAAYARLSADQSNGFRDSSGFRGRNLFVSASKQNDDSLLRISGFTAHERTQQSFLATDAETLKSDLRFNPMQPEERDSFGYDLGQVQYLRSNWTASVFYQRGYGWYRLWDDESAKDTLRQYGIDGLLLGSMVTYTTPHITYGVHVNQFRREHTRDVVDGGRDYFNYGTKGEANAFAKASYDFGRWHLYGDGQVRTTNFRYHGDVAIDPIRWTFFNPKIGARYDLTPASGVYASAGLSRREPARNDLFQGEDNPSFAHDLHAVKPERLLDLEAGYNFHTGAMTLAANVYAMEFRHEIASTGELSEIGLLLRKNVDRSYRRGIEIEAAWQLSPLLRLRGNANLSSNRISSWTQFFDVYDDAGNYVTSEPLQFRNVNPVLTPRVIVNQSIDYVPIPRLTLGATGRYTGKAYLDNTNDEHLTTPSFFTLDADAAYDLGRGARVRLHVGNLLDNQRVFPNGYSYNFIAGGVVSGTAYYYPQATRNAVLTLEWRR